MIIYNTAEIKSKYVAKDELIIEIRSALKPEEILEKLRKGEELSTDEVSITAYKTGNGEFKTLLEQPEMTHLVSEVRQIGLDAIMGQEALEDAIEEYEVDKTKVPKLFQAFEGYSFNRPWQDVPFAQTEISNEMLKDELYAALGIMPTLKGSDDKTIQELKKMSANGERLYWGFMKQENYNTLPTREEIEFYENLNDYEKRVINESRMNPKLMLRFAQALKEKTPGRMLTEESAYEYISRGSTRMTAVVDEIEDCPYKLYSGEYSLEKQIARADELFKEKFHGRAPRVLKEYVTAFYYAQGIIPSADVSHEDEELLQKITDTFDQKNVSKVAKYKSLALFALSDKLNYNEVKEDHLQALAVYVKNQNIKPLIDKGFVDWYKAHKNTNTSELVNLIKKIGKLTRFDVNKSAKDLIMQIENARGYEDAKKYEESGNYPGFKFENNEIAIKGRHVVAKQGKMTMYMLDAKDYRNFTVGYDTHCCQHFGNAGADCVRVLASDPFSACVVIERDSKILAQSFVWVDVVKDTFVFDNVEFANDGEIPKYMDLFAAYCRALPYENVHVGTGYNQGMNGLGRPVKEEWGAVLPTTVGPKCGYSDYHVRGSLSSVARAFKQGGQMLVTEKLPVAVSTKPDEPTKWDELAQPATAFMLNDYRSSVESRLSFAREFNNNQTPEIQMEAVKRNPMAITAITNPTEEVQRYLVNLDKKMAMYINNPCRSVQMILVESDPSYIKNIQNPDEETCLKVVKKDGHLIRFIDHPSDRVVRAAVEQDGYVIRDLPSQYQTEEVQLIAVRSNPKVVSTLYNPSEAVLRQAIQYDPHVIGLLEVEEPLQRIAVEQDPSVINEIKNPAYNVIRRAVEKNGTLVRNFQYNYPQLRAVAISQNPFAINALKNPTDEEYVMAVSRNPRVANTIRDPEKKANVLAAVAALAEQRETGDDGIELE